MKKFKTGQSSHHLDRDVILLDHSIRNDPHASLQENMPIRYSAPWRPDQKEIDEILDCQMKASFTR